MGGAWGREEVQTGFWWGKPDGKGLLGIPRRRWEDNIKMDLQEVGWESMDWIGLDEDRCRWRALGGYVTSVSVKCGELVDFALRSGLLKAVRVTVVPQFHLLCKYFISYPEFPRQLSAVCNFIKFYSPLCLDFMYPMF